MKQNEVIITGVHMDLTDAIKEKVHDKSGRLLKHEGTIISIKYELEYHNLKGNSREEFIATGHIDINGPNIIASVTSDNLYKSIDQLVEKLDRQLRRRSRKSNTKRKSNNGVDIPANLPKTAFKAS